jgi:glycosyltransferase involved in cell wall biosynthesis
VSGPGTRHHVFIGLTEAAGYLGGLRQGFEDLGVPTLYFDGGAHPFGYARVDVLGRAGRVVERIRARRDAEGSPAMHLFWKFAASLAHVARAALKLGLLTRALLRCDVFILAAGETFFRRLDHVLIRAFRKRLIVVFLGSDHRPPYLNGRWVRTMPGRDLALQLQEIRFIRDRVRTAERGASAVIANGASAQFHVRPFVQIIALGIPGLPPAEVYDRSLRLFKGQGVRILHAPSEPLSKGTDVIREAVSGLRALGYAIDYVEIAGRPHAEVLSALRRCDLVVDEVYSDAPMAMFSAEAAFYGKPALITGYYANLVGSELPVDIIPPSLFCLPHELPDGLRRLVADKAYREDLGQRAAAYVQARWTPAQVARRYLRVIDGDVPRDWIVDPLASRYVHGWGMPDELRRQAIRAIVSEAGAAALCLTDRPDLERLLVEAAS